MWVQDTAPDGVTRMPVKDLAGLASVYAMVARGLGDQTAMIDDFYVDPRTSDRPGVGASPNGLSIGSEVPITATAISGALVFEELPVILHGSGGPLGEHFVLLTGIRRGDVRRDALGRRNAEVLFRALDPYPVLGAGHQGREIWMRFQFFEGQDRDPIVLKHPHLSVRFTSLMPITSKQRSIPTTESPISGPTGSKPPAQESSPESASSAVTTAVVYPRLQPNSAKPTYPPAAQRLRLEGTVTLGVFVREDGMVESARIEQSSSEEILDNAALGTALLFWRFVPGTENGKPKAMWVKVRVTFKCNENGIDNCRA